MNSLDTTAPYCNAILSKEELHCNMEHFLGIDTSKAKAVKL
jgi:hypothetical protein